MSQPRVPILAEAIEAGVLTRLSSASRVKVFSVIAQHADAETREAWPSVERIARLAGIGRSSVFAALRDLEELGLLVTLARGGGRRANGQGASNRYRLPRFSGSEVAPPNRPRPRTVNGPEPETRNSPSPGTVNRPGFAANGPAPRTPNGPDGRTRTSKRTSKEDSDERARSESPPPSDRATRAEAIYNAYPRKVARRAALTAIERAAKRLADAGHADPRGHLLERTSAFAKSPAGQPPPRGSPADFRPYPATWFNADRYDDDPAEWNRLNASTQSPQHPNEAGGRVAAAPGKYDGIGVSVGG
ncbi:MAG: helix-turn-helix domain-containing protein [Planctomycetota bacterium]